MIKLGFKENISKAQFVSAMEWKWTCFAQKDNDWMAFLRAIEQGNFVN